MKFVEVNDIRDDDKGTRKWIDIDKIVSIDMTPDEATLKYSKRAVYVVCLQSGAVLLSYDELVKLLKLLPKAEKL